MLSAQAAGIGSSFEKFKTPLSQMNALSKIFRHFGCMLVRSEWVSLECPLFLLMRWFA